jgi:hypothetical protein
VPEGVPLCGFTFSPPPPPHATSNSKIPASKDTKQKLKNVICLCDNTVDQTNATGPNQKQKKAQTNREGHLLSKFVDATEPAAVYTVKVEAPAFPSELIVSVPGDSWQLVPLGVFVQLHDSVTIPVNSFCGAILTVKLAEFPADMVVPAGLIVIAKSGSPSITCVRGDDVRGLKWASPL